MFVEAAFQIYISLMKKISPDATNKDPRLAEGRPRMFHLDDDPMFSTDKTSTCSYTEGFGYVRP